MTLELKVISFLILSTHLSKTILLHIIFLHASGEEDAHGGFKEKDERWRN